MGVLDISDITSSLMNLIKEVFSRSSELGAMQDLEPKESGIQSGNVTVYPEPPIRLQKRGIGFYLYHIAENPYFKNLPAPGGDNPPVRYAPMGLNLYYQLSAHDPDTSEEYRAINEQRMMGVAMKALHDHPDIADSTTIYDTKEKVFTTELQEKGVKLRIALQPTPPNEAVTFWTAGESPVKLSAYYEVSVVFLQPEQSRKRSGRVLSYQVNVSTEGAPRLFSSQSKIAYRLPGSSEVQEITLQPAQVLPGDPPPPDPPEESAVTFMGTGLSGDETALLLIHPRWKYGARAGAGWQVKLGQGMITAFVQKTADALDQEAVFSSLTTAVPIIPGIYAAQWVVRRHRRFPGGEVQAVEYRSNQCPFTISPPVDSISINTSNREITVKGYFYDAGIEVYAGADRLTEVSVSPPTENGTFYVQDGHTIVLKLPSGMDPARKYLPLRIFVNGAESHPRWIDLS